MVINCVVSGDFRASRSPGGESKRSWSASQKGRRTNEIVSQAPRCLGEIEREKDRRNPGEGETNDFLGGQQKKEKRTSRGKRGRPWVQWQQNVLQKERKACEEGDVPGVMGLVFEKEKGVKTGG